MSPFESDDSGSENPTHASTEGGVDEPNADDVLRNADNSGEDDDDGQGPHESISPFTSEDSDVSDIDEDETDIEQNMGSSVDEPDQELESNSPGHEENQDDTQTTQSEDREISELIEDGLEMGSKSDGEENESATSEEDGTQSSGDTNE
jgi:hypothetical protein